MSIKFVPNNPILKFSRIDTEDDKITKVFISMENNLIPLSGIQIQYTKDGVFYKTILDSIDDKMLLKNFNEYLSRYSLLNDELLKMMHITFPKLTKDELFTLNSYLINKSIPGINANLDKIEKLKKDNVDMKKELIKKFLKTSMKEEFIKKYINSYDDYNVTLTSVNLQISKTPLDIYKIIKTYKLSKKVPFMMTIKESSNEPIIKYHKSINKTQLDDWIYTQDNKLKNPKGLIIKVFYEKENDYKTINVSKSTPNIHVKLGFLQENIQYKNLKTEILSDLTDILDELKKYIDVKDHVPIKTSIVNFNIGINFKEPVETKKIAIWLRNNYELYSFESFKDRVKFKNHRESYNFAVKTIDKQTSLTISQLLNEEDIKKSIQEFFEILLNVSDLKVILQKEDKPKGQKKTRKLKDLKALGIFVNSADCQKIRHIDIYDDTKKVPENSYILDYKNVKLFCNTDSYPYPGFTNSNAPCCFKKDQRDKEVYLRNTGVKSKKIIVSDEQILRTNLITTNKILDMNRIGVIPYFLKDLFDENYMRVGVYKSSLLNAVEFLTNAKIQETLLSSIDKNFYKTILLPNNKILSELVPYEDYVETLKTLKTFGKMKTSYLQNVLEKKLNTGIIIINVNFDQEELNMEIPDVYWNLDDYQSYIFILHITTRRKQGIYEPIVKLHDNKKKFDKIFNVRDPTTELIHRVFTQLNLKKLSPLLNEPPHIKVLLKSGVKVTSQLVNLFNKIEYVETEKGIIPVKLTVPLTNIKMTLQFQKLFTFKQQISLLKDLSKKYDAYEPVALMKSNKVATAILTKSGIIVPIQESKADSGNLQIIENKIPVNLSNLIYENKKVSDQASNYIDKLQYKNELYEHFRFLLSSILQNKEIKRDLKNVMLDNINFNTRFKAVEKIVDKLLQKFIKKTKREVLVTNLPSVRGLCHMIENCEINKFCTSTKEGCRLEVNNNVYEIMLNKLVIELFNNNDIFKGNIQVEFMDKNNFISRKDEKIILTTEDLKKILR